MNSNFEWVSSLMFEDVPPPVRFYDMPRLSVNSGGVMTMNQPLQKTVDCTRPVSMKISADGRVLQLFSSENGGLEFSPKGQLKHAGFLADLQKKGVQVPCRYLFEWWPEREVWIGCSEDLPAPPTLEKPGRKRRRNVP